MSIRCLKSVKESSNWDEQKSIHGIFKAKVLIWEEIVCLESKVIHSLSKVWDKSGSRAPELLSQNDVATNGDQSQMILSNDSLS